MVFAGEFMAHYWRIYGTEFWNVLFKYIVWFEGKYDVRYDTGMS